MIEVVEFDRSADYLDWAVVAIKYHRDGKQYGVIFKAPTLNEARATAKRWQMENLNDQA